MGELEDLREAQRIVREMIESARVRMRKQVVAALTIIDRPGYPDAATERERALIRDAATGIRHQYLIERGTTSVDWSMLLKRVSDDERRVLEAAHRASAGQPDPDQGRNDHHGLGGDDAGRGLYRACRLRLGPSLQQHEPRDEPDGGQRWACGVDMATSDQRSGAGNGNRAVYAWDRHGDEYGVVYRWLTRARSGG